MSEGIHPFFGYELPVDLVRMTGGGPETFDDISAVHIQDLKRDLDITSRSHLVEIGCGIGRDAIPLTQILTEGRYDGIDIIGTSIKWLQANVTPQHPNFHFHHFNVSDQLHNPDGVQEQNENPIPLEDGVVDGIFLWSVFTHMLEENILFYLSEFHRVLKPGGKVFATCFMYDDAVLEKARETNLTIFDLRFEHPWGDRCLVNDADHPLGAVAFTRDKLEEMVAASGLHLDRIAKGIWSGYWPDGEGGQDVLLLSKTS